MEQTVRDQIENLRQHAEATARELAEREIALRAELADVEQQLDRVTAVPAALDLLERRERVRREIEAVEIVRRVVRERDARQLERTALHAQRIEDARERIARLEQRLEGTRNSDDRRLIEQDLAEWREQLTVIEGATAA